MFPKRFIYRDGILIPKNRDQEHDNNYYFINLSRNGNLINTPISMPSIFLSEIKKDQIKKPQEEEKKINECNNNINEEAQTISNINKDNDYNNDINNKFEQNVNFNKKIKNIKIITKPKKSQLYQQIEQICKHFYLNQSNTSKNNIYNEMYQKENEYVKNLKKNYLSNEDLILRRKHSYKNFSRLIKHNLSVQNNSVKNSQIKNNNSFKSNKISEEKISPEQMKKYYDEDMKNTIDNKKRINSNYKNIRINSYNQKYSYVHQLKSEDKLRLPAIKSSKKYPIELTNLIPIKKGIKREDNLNEYMFYKVMKSNRLSKFHL